MRLECAGSQLSGEFHGRPSMAPANSQVWAINVHAFAVDPQRYAPWLVCGVVRSDFRDAKPWRTTMRITRIEGEWAGASGDRRPCFPNDSTWCCRSTVCRSSSAKPKHPCGRRSPGSTGQRKSTTTMNKACRRCSCRTCSAWVDGHGDSFARLFLSILPRKRRQARPAASGLGSLENTTQVGVTEVPSVNLPGTNPLREHSLFASES
jgi:hypothetical protein